MGDLIDRAEAISRAVELRMYGKPVKMVPVSELEGLPKRGEATLPEQAHSDRLGVKTGETCTDTISRQAAIEKFEPWLKVDGYSEGELNMLKAVLYELRFLPSAQPEPLTDKEQRIFLAAMEREEKVCEEVDRNHVREPYEDSLMRVCKEIRRKVKGALWTN